MANSSRVLDALGDPTRRAIFELVAAAPAAVTDIARRMPVSRPAVSQHLRVLKEAELLCDEAVGTRRIYRLHPAGLEALRSYLDRFWDEPLAAFKQAAERTAREEKKKR